jgi:hypothetical protein
MTTRPAPQGSVNAMSNDKNRSGRPGREWPHWRRVTALAVAAAIVLLACGCGGNPSSSSSGASSADGSSTIQKEVAYANCLTSHGVTGVSVGSGGALTITNGNNRMTAGSGALPPQALQSSPTLKSAAQACSKLAPSNGQQQPSQGQAAANLKQALKFTQCMRSHGVPNFPDPNSSGGFSGSSSIGGANPQSSSYQKAQRACQSLIPAPSQGG